MHLSIPPVCPAGHWRGSVPPTLIGLWGGGRPGHVGQSGKASLKVAPKTIPAGLHLYWSDPQSAGVAPFVTFTWMMFRAEGGRTFLTFVSFVWCVLVGRDLPVASVGTGLPFRNTSAELSAATQMVPSVGSPQR